jgi:hypothetical protein
MAAAQPPAPVSAHPSHRHRPPTLPIAPNTAATAAAEAAARAAARAAYEEDQGVLRLLRMTLRDITMKLLCNRR